MTLRKMNFKKVKVEPRGVPSWDTAGFGPVGKLPIKYAGLENSVELDRATFRDAIGAIHASGAVYWIENSSSPPPCFVYRFGNAEHPQRLFALAVYPRNKPAQYFMILERMSYKLRQMVERVMRDGKKEATTFNNVAISGGAAQGPKGQPGRCGEVSRGRNRDMERTVSTGGSLARHGKGSSDKVSTKAPPPTRRASPSHPWRRK